MYGNYKAVFSEPLIVTLSYFCLLSGLFYYLAVPVAGELQALSFVMSPQAAATSVVKIAVSALCVSAGYAALAALKEGPLAAYQDRPSAAAAEMSFES